MDNATNHRFRVLIADDDPDTVEMLAERFNAAFCEVIKTYDGAQAISAFIFEMDNQRAVDFCILDYEMPFVKGDVAAVKIQQMCFDVNSEPPEIVIFTGTSDPNLVHRLQAAGIGIALLKPQGLRQLESIIKRFSRGVSQETI